MHKESSIPSGKLKYEIIICLPSTRKQMVFRPTDIALIDEFYTTLYTFLFLHSNPDYSILSSISPSFPNR